MWLECSILVKLQHWLKGLAAKFLRDSDTQNSTGLIVIKFRWIFFQERMTGGEEVKRKGVIHVSGVNRSSSLGSTHTHSVCASQHVFPIWFHPVPQHWLNADLFSLIFLLSHVLLFCSFFSSQSNLSLLSLSPSSLSLSRRLSLTLFLSLP